MSLPCLRLILLTAFDQLRAGIHAKLDLVMLNDGALVSQTKWADNQLVTSDVPIAKQLLAHLTSKKIPFLSGAYRPLHPTCDPGSCR